MKNLTIFILCSLGFISACSSIDQALYSRSIVEVEVDERIYKVNRFPNTNDTWLSGLSESKNQNYVPREYLFQTDQRIKAIEIVSGCKVIPKSVVHINATITKAKVTC